MDAYYSAGIFEFVFIYYTVLSSIDGAVWQDTPDIVKISTVYNNLTEIPDLSRATKLRELYLQGNRITNIPAFIFDGLSELKMVNLMYTSIKTVNTDSFAGLTNTDLSLSLSSSNLFNSNLTLDMYVSQILPTNMSSYFHGWVTMPDLPQIKWDRFPYLKSLTLYWTSQFGISRQMFEGAVHLQTLALRRDTIYNLDPAVLLNLPSLTKLDLYHPRGGGLTVFYY